jgi:hypothetical protein
MEGTSDGGRLLPGGYRIELFAEQDDVSPGDVIELWTREADLTPEEAARRMSEILVVATDPERRLGGVSTAYLGRNEQLGADLWHIRIFVAEAHRQRHLAIDLARAASDTVLRRYVSGVDRRGIGMLYRIQSEVLRRALPDAVSRATKFAFIGEDADGSQVRVRYFPGALAPGPDHLLRPGEAAPDS